MSEANAEFYQAVIDEHRRRPRNRGPLPFAQRVARRENPACGDLCTIQLQLDGDRIITAAFTGAGCALSQASASLATIALTGRTSDEARTLAATIAELIRTGAENDNASPAAPLGDLAALAAAHAFPARHACALLAWQATLDALNAPPPL